jgi:Mn-dependent DtxR family transcriptional regulator
MISTIGDAAGKIWAYLNSNGECTLASIKKDLELKPEQVTMSLGWLAREGKVKMQKSGTSVKVQLIN